MGVWQIYANLGRVAKKPLW